MKMATKLHVEQSRSSVTSSLTCRHLVVIFCLLCPGRTSPMGIRDKRAIHSSHIHAQHTSTPLQLFHLNSHRRLLFCQSYRRERWREGVRDEGEKGVGKRK